MKITAHSLQLTAHSRFSLFGVRFSILLLALCLCASVADAQVLYQTDFPCYPEGVTAADDTFGTTTYWSGISDRAGNVKDPLDHTGNGTCSARVGAGANGYGKLMVHLLDASGAQTSHGDLWLRGWVYFHPNYPVPCCGDVLISPHLWRFHEPNWRFERDFSTVQGQDRVRDYYFWKVSGGPDGTLRYYDSNFHFASADRRGRWQCWEIRTKLNTPGAADGISEFYADGVLIGRHEGLNLRGNTTYGYGKVDIQSNIALPTGAALPPDMWWLVDDVVIATERVGCGDSAPAPPPATEDPAPEPEPAPDPEPTVEERLATLEADVATLKEKLAQDAEARRQIAELRTAFQAVLTRLRIALQP